APGTDAARPAPTLACLAIVAAAASCYVFGPTPLSYNYVPSLYDTGRYQAVLEIQELIPQDAAVLATERIAAHFTGQDLLHTLGWEPAADYDFVLVDLDDEWAGREEMFAVRNKCLAGGQYAPVYARDAFVLFKKGARTPAALQLLGPYDGDVEDVVKGRAPVEGGDEARIVRLQLARSQVGAERTDLTVVLYWKCLEPIKTDRGFTITVACATPHDVKVFGRTFHPCLGLFPTSMWKPGMVIADRYDFRLPFDPGKGGMRLRFAWEKWQPRNEGRMVEGEGEKADR
ncbi:MAG: hypothetical protein HQ592_10540, partial [Planctomycetes bacterium]|nr:hypothetical protein [Planctomycetota bacterium]